MVQNITELPLEFVPLEKKIKNFIYKLTSNLKVN